MCVPNPGRGVNWPWLAHPGSSSRWEGGGSQRGRGNSSYPLCFGRHADTGSSHGTHQGLVQVGTEGRETLSQMAWWPCALRRSGKLPAPGSPSPAWLTRACCRRTLWAGEEWESHPVSIRDPPLCTASPASTGSVDYRPAPSAPNSPSLKLGL